MAELPVPEMQSRDRATDRPWQREYGDRSERARPRDESCRDLGVTCSSEYFRHWQEPTSDSCTPSTRRGYPIPDPRCTPGGIDPSVKLNALRDSQWKTRCIRNCETSEQEKHVAYSWYGIQKPRSNSGDNQVCRVGSPRSVGTRRCRWHGKYLAGVWPECDGTRKPLFQGQGPRRELPGRRSTSRAHAAIRCTTRHRCRLDTVPFGSESLL